MSVTLETNKQTNKRSLLCASVTAPGLSSSTKTKTIKQIFFLREINVTLADTKLKKSILFEK